MPPNTGYPRESGGVCHSAPVTLAALIAVVVLAVPAGAEPSPAAGFAQRHKDFSRSTVHFVGAAEAVRLTARHRPEATAEPFIRRTLRNAKQLIAGHGAFPPYPAAWEDPDRIEAWQEAMDRLTALRKQASEQLEKGETDQAAALVNTMRKRFHNASEPSGYPPGTFEFLGLRAVAKAARDLEPEARHRLENELLKRLTEQRDRFTAARKPLLGPDRKQQFEKRLEKLHRAMIEMVRREGPIGEDAVRDMHTHFPPFHRPAVLERLSRETTNKES